MPQLDFTTYGAQISLLFFLFFGYLGLVRISIHRMLRNRVMRHFANYFRLATFVWRPIVAPFTARYQRSLALATHSHYAARLELCRRACSAGPLLSIEELDRYSVLTYSLEQARAAQDALLAGAAQNAA